MADGRHDERIVAEQLQVVRDVAACRRIRGRSSGTKNAMLRM
jgi:hypothetical protein